MLIVALALVLLLAILSPFGSAQADSDGAPCDQPTITVVDSPEHIVHHDAVTHDEVVHHDAVTHVVHHDAVTHEETVVDSPAIWANWAPNDTQGPQDYVPVWPTDARGTWILHDQGIPPGHEGPDGVYQQGGGNSPWFYRQNEVSHTETVVDTPAYDETVVDQEAYDETVTIVDTPAYDETVPAVTHEEDNPNYPCDSPQPPEPKPGPPTVIHKDNPAPKQEKQDVPVVIEAGL